MKSSADGLTTSMTFPISAESIQHSGTAFHPVPGFSGDVFFLLMEKYLQMSRG